MSHSPASWDTFSSSVQGLTHPKAQLPLEQLTRVLPYLLIQEKLYGDIIYIHRINPLTMSHFSVVMKLVHCDHNLTTLLKTFPSDKAVVVHTFNSRGKQAD